MAASPAGASLFARYAYPPNELGHCGPPGAAAMFAGGAHGAGPGEAAQVRARAPAFQGAWAYLELLAGVAGLDDPLHPDVVSAYWLGGDLLDRVPDGAVAGLVRGSFGAQPGVRDRLAWLPRLASAGPCHAFHVFVVYPWVGLLGAGGDVARSTLDLCRVRWGTVESLDGTHAAVRTQALSWDGGALGLGAEHSQRCRYAGDGGAFVASLSVGDTVALHWDWVCDRLDPAAAGELERRTRGQLAATNEWLRDRATPSSTVDS
jgi:Family of unknown function (DUF6390)